LFWIFEVQEMSLPKSELVNTLIYHMKNIKMHELVHLKLNPLFWDKKWIF